MTARNLRVTSHQELVGDFTREGDDSLPPSDHGCLQARTAGTIGRGGAHEWVARRALSSRLVTAAMLAVLAAGCGGQAPVPLAEAGPVAQQSAPTDVAAAAAPADEDEAKAPAPGPAGDAGDDASGQDGSNASDPLRKDSAAGEPPGDDTSSRGNTGANTAADPATDAGGSTVEQPPMDEVDVAGVVEPACVRPGGTITLTVTTDPQASVAYNAFYSDGSGGGPPPYGAGHGGNDGGLAGEQGRYADSWTVAATAPSGKASVEVIAGSNGKFGKTSVPFEVGDAATGQCSP